LFVCVDFPVLEVNAFRVVQSLSDVQKFFFFKNLKVRHPHCVRTIIQSIYCVYIYIYIVNKHNIGEICKIELHVSALQVSRTSIVHGSKFVARRK
jgi:hypothetical protein